VFSINTFHALKYSIHSLNRSSGWVEYYVAVVTFRKISSLKHIFCFKIYLGANIIFQQAPLVTTVLRKRKHMTLIPEIERSGSVNTTTHKPYYNYISKYITLISYNQLKGLNLIERVLDCNIEK